LKIGIKFTKKIILKPQISFSEFSPFWA